MVSVAILGASGYAGGELVRLIDEHPSMEVSLLGAHSQVGSSLGDVHPHLSGTDRVLAPYDVDLLADSDLVFLALPHGASTEIGHELAAGDKQIVDLGSDFRMDTSERYASAYGAPHLYPDELSGWVYGLPELFGDQLMGAQLVSSPGCYPTASLLPAAPLLKAGVIGGPVIVNALSGVSGAGRSLREDLLFGAINESARAYEVTTHRHRPEIEMVLERFCSVETVPTLFTPHLVPMHRGIHATVTAPVASGVTENDLRGALREFYSDKPFVNVRDDAPRTSWVAGSNRAEIAAFLDESTGYAVLVCVIDNLIKGAAGQAIQAANLMLGLPETVGLPFSGWAL